MIPEDLRYGDSVLVDGKLGKIRRRKEINLDLTPLGKGSPVYLNGYEIEMDDGQKVTVDLPERLNGPKVERRCQG